MSARSRALGSSFERELRDGFRSKGIDTERLRLAGKLDEGDLVIKDLGHTYIVEAKNVQRLDLPRFISESEVEAANYAAARGLSVDSITPLVIAKRRGKGWLDAYVIQTVRNHFDLG